MRLTDPLNERQLAVLRWIADGCPPGVFEGHIYKRTAGSLRDRKLVTISRAGGNWSAALTDAGRHYLANGHHPETADSRAHRRTPPSTARRTRPAAPSRPAAKLTPAEVAAPAVDADELLRQLAAASGRLTISDPDRATRAAWRRAIDAVRREHRVPAGQHLVHQGRDHGDLVIELRDGPHPTTSAEADHLPLPVPEVVKELHPLLAALSDPVAALGMSAVTVDRALRVLHVLLTAAEQEGCTVGWAGRAGGDLAFRRDGQLVLLHFFEVIEYRHVLPATDELATTKTYSWQRVQAEPREVATGRLRMELDHDYNFSGQHRRWGDQQRWKLESRLGQVLRAVIHRLDGLAARQRAQEEAAQQRQREWEAAMANARQAFRSDRRRQALDRQLDAWDKANRIRAYCHALDQLDDDRPDRHDWIAWARDYADRLDPRGRNDQAPADVEPRPEDLRPFLGRQWNPYRP